MLKNILTIAFRNIRRHKGFSFINILGLTLGLTASLLIGLFVRDEKQFDKFIPDGDRIYRVYYKITGDGGTGNQACTTPMLATALQQNFPEVEKAARIFNYSDNKIFFEAGEVKLYEQGGILAEPSFFDIFPLSFKHGTNKDALTHPNSIILSEETAQKFFGNENPVGKEILLNKSALLVKGVFRNDIKFHLDLNYILPLSAAGLSTGQMQNWGWYGMYTYVKLKAGANVPALAAKFQDYTNPFLNKEPGDDFKPDFQPLQQIHLYSADFKFEMASLGNITYVKALIIIGIFILLIACFNFINLATAKSIQRAKEVGIRKTIGANRRQLMILFIGETVFLTCISIGFATILTTLLLPSLNQFTGKSIVFGIFSNPLILLFLLVISLVVGILAGFYPALVLSGFQPVKVLKGAFTGDIEPGKTPWLRHGLVVVQFSLSILLIISAIVVFNQVNYLHNKELGFKKEQIMFFPMRGENMINNYGAFKNKLLESPGVASVSVGYGFPGDIFGDGLMTVPLTKEQKKATQLMVDHDYIKTLGLQLIAGRDFSREMKTDQDEAFIINETAVYELGFGSPEKALGQTLMWPTWSNPDSMKKAKVIGVVKDFHYKSLYNKVEPAVLQIYPQAYSKVAVKIRAADIENTIAHVNKTWNVFTPEFPNEYHFLDESFDHMYKADDKLKSLLTIFTFIAIFVACLGLFGLAAYASERRKKEIGIRKILGASVSEITFLLSKEFIKLVIIALLLASPVAWYLMNQWLQDFAYRINMEWWMFVLTALGAIAIALITISFQIMKAAFANPARNIRVE